MTAIACTKSDGHRVRRRQEKLTHIVKAAEFVHQPVELEQVQVPVAQNWPFIDRSSYERERRQ